MKIREMDGLNAAGKKFQICGDINWIGFKDRNKNYTFFEAYPSAYQPPPLSSKVHVDIIFFAFFLQWGHSEVLVSILTNSSKT